jgi:hypothetical protein
MADELDTYTFPETGEMIFTSHFLKKRKRCCRSTCLHCPFGHTLEVMKFEIREYEPEQKLYLDKVLNENEYNKPLSVADSLLSQNLGSKRKSLDLTEFKPSDIKMIYLKNYFVGFLTLRNGELDQYFLGKQFQFQNIERSHIESSLLS